MQNYLGTFRPHFGKISVKEHNLKFQENLGLGLKILSFHYL